MTQAKSITATRAHDLATKFMAARVSEMKKTPFSAIVISGMLLGFTIADANAQQPPSGSFGKLDNFYRAMQLQGNLAIMGQGLVTPPGWLEGNDIDIRYHPKAASRTGKEILFTDSIIINRFLGGQWSSAVNSQIKPLIPYDEEYPWRSLDYFRTTPPATPSGKWKFYGDVANGDLIDARMKPYLDAGYGFSDITLMLSNVPWDAAAKTAHFNSSCLSPPGKLTIANYPQTGGMGGDNEQCNPPAFPRLWQAIIGHLAQDLVAHYGAANAGSIRFELGDELDSRQNTSMDFKDYRSYCEGAYTEIRKLLPNAEISPGGFTGNGNEPGKVYDTPRFLVEEAEAGRPAAVVTRSLNAIWGFPHPGRREDPKAPGGVTPNGDVSRAVASYQTIKTAFQSAGVPFDLVPEIHQFGFLSFPQPVGWGVGSDQASISANWYFQTLMGLKQHLKVRRVCHWDTTVSIPTAAGIVLLNGIGFVDLLLDDYQGALLYDLPTAKTGSISSEPKATAMWKDGATTFVLSNFDLGAAAAPARIQVKIPDDLFAAGRPGKFRYLRYSLSPIDNVFAAIKADLDSAGLLSERFKNCALCYGPPASMQTDYRAMLSLVEKNWPKYQAIMKGNLKWRSADDGSLDQNGVAHKLVQSGSILTVTLRPDEMLILKSP